MFRTATGHDADGGDLFDGGFPSHGQEMTVIALDAGATHLSLAILEAVVGLELENLIGLVAGALEHCGDALFGREDDRKTVGVLADFGAVELWDLFSLAEEGETLIIGAFKDNTGIGGFPDALLLFSGGERPGEGVHKQGHDLFSGARWARLTRNCIAPRG